MSVGEKIRALRERRGLQQNELAEQAGITQAHLSAIERGQTENPHLNTTKALLEALDIDPDRLFKFMIREVDKKEFLEFCEET